MAYLNAILLAVVEGVTEFLPVSSTGHLILLEQWLPLGGDPEFEKAFMVIIQLPAILAVVLYFWPRLWPFHAKADAAAVVMLWLKVAAAFFPAAVLGCTKFREADWGMLFARTFRTGRDAQKSFQPYFGGNG